MGMFDFLKVSVKKEPAKKGGGKTGSNRVQIDSKSFSIGAITPSGFIATSFDGSLVKGQNARLSVFIDDQFAKFNFDATVTVADTSGGVLTVQFGMLSPEIEGMLRKYAQLRKQKPGK